MNIYKLKVLGRFRTYAEPVVYGNAPIHRLTESEARWASNLVDENDCLIDPDGTLYRLQLNNGQPVLWKLLHTYADIEDTRIQVTRSPDTQRGLRFHVPQHKGPLKVVVICQTPGYNEYEAAAVDNQIVPLIKGVFDAGHEIIERINRFDTICREAEHTDTGEAWELLHHIRALLSKLDQRIDPDSGELKITKQRIK